jgi:hypothetical protein
MCSQCQWSSKQRIRLNLPISALYLHFSDSGAASTIIGGRGRIFISSCSALLTSFEIHCFYGLWTQIYEYWPPPPNYRAGGATVQRCISISAFYPHFSVLSPFQRFILISAFYPHFIVLSPFQRFIPISAFYPHFSILSPFSLRF